MTTRNIEEERARALLTLRRAAEAAAAFLDTSDEDLEDAFDGGRLAGRGRAERAARAAALLRGPATPVERSVEHQPMHRAA
jgi:hypothetical protein